MKFKVRFIQLAVVLTFPFCAALAGAASITIKLLTTFDYPGAGNQTIPQKINDAGEVAGLFTDADGVTRGFLRARDGTFGAPIVEPNDTGGATEVRGINNSDTLSGWFLKADLTAHGFLWSGGTFTEFDLPGHTNNYIYGIDDAGNFCGDVDGLGFIRYTSGAVAVVAINVATTTSFVELNNLGVAVGDYVDLGGISHGFVRDNLGNLAYPIDAPGSVMTNVGGNNDQGVIVGSYQDSGGATHAFATTQTRAAYVFFDYPGATYTTFTGINLEGDICGSYRDPSGVEHGIVAHLKRRLND